MLSCTRDVRSCTACETPPACLSRRNKASLERSCLGSISLSACRMACNTLDTSKAATVSFMPGLLSPAPRGKRPTDAFVVVLAQELHSRRTRNWASSRLGPSLRIVASEASELACERVQEDFPGHLVAASDLL